MKIVSGSRLTLSIVLISSYSKFKHVCILNKQPFLLKTCVNLRLKKIKTKVGAFGKGFAYQPQLGNLFVLHKV